MHKSNLIIMPGCDLLLQILSNVDCIPIWGSLCLGMDGLAALAALPLSSPSGGATTLITCGTRPPMIWFTWHPGSFCILSWSDWSKYLACLIGWDRAIISKVVLQWELSIRDSHNSVKTLNSKLFCADQFSMCKIVWTRNKERTHNMELFCAYKLLPYCEFDCTVCTVQVL